MGNFGGVTAELRPSHGFPASALLTLPKDAEGIKSVGALALTPN